MSYDVKAELGMANDAPGEALVDTIDWSKWRKRAAWVIGIIALILIVLVYFYKKDQQHEADTAEAVKKVSVSESNAAATPQKPKIATKKVAPKAEYTPPIVEFGSMVQAPIVPTIQVAKKVKKPLSPEDAAFEKELDDLETELKKDSL